MPKGIGAIIIMFLIRTLKIQDRAEKAIKEFQPMHPGDVVATAADTSALEAWVGFRPSTKLETIQYTDITTSRS